MTMMTTTTIPCKVLESLSWFDQDHIFMLTCKRSGENRWKNKIRKLCASFTSIVAPAVLSFSCFRITWKHNRHRSTGAKEQRRPRDQDEDIELLEIQVSHLLCHSLDPVVQVPRLLLEIHLLPYPRYPWRKTTYSCSYESWKQMILTWGWGWGWG